MVYFGNACGWRSDPEFTKEAKHIMLKPDECVVAYRDCEECESYPNGCSLIGGKKIPITNDIILPVMVRFSPMTFEAVKTSSGQNHRVRDAAKFLTDLTRKEEN